MASRPIATFRGDAAVQSLSERSITLMADLDAGATGTMRALTDAGATRRLRPVPRILPGGNACGNSPNPDGAAAPSRAIAI
jgi:hypothetical protein